MGNLESELGVTLLERSVHGTRVTAIAASQRLQLRCASPGRRRARCVLCPFGTSTFQALEVSPGTKISLSTSSRNSECEYSDALPLSQSGSEYRFPHV
ncbi:hypothetical protein D9M72_607780 [compost metagenome]